MRHSSIVRSPGALGYMQHGIDQLAGLLALTLGPTRGLVLLDRGNRAPEALSDSGTIARRVVALPNRAADVGAMTLRHTVWTVRERYGDGAARAAVLAQALVHEAAKRVAANYDPMLMRRGIERAVAAVSQALATQAVPAEGQELLARLATGVTGDAQLGALLGEMFDVLGAGAALTLEEYAAPYLEREYIDGGRWQARSASRHLLPDERGEQTLPGPRVVVVDQELTTLAQVRPLLELALAAGREPLLLVARKIAGEALGTLVINHTNGVLTVAAVELSNYGFVGEEIADLALLTGATLLSELTGRPPQSIQAADMGRARRATLGRDGLTIVGGAGDQAAVQTQIAALRRRLARVSRTDGEWERLRLRIACLAGGVGVLKIGAYSKTERELRYELARQAVRTLDLAMTEGVVPGGGVAYLQAVPAALAAAEACSREDEAQGAAVVAAALVAPFCQIIRNQGLEAPAVALANVRRLGAGYGFDVLRGEYVRMADAGVLDPLAVVRGAFEAAASAAILTITTDVIVLASARRREKRVDP